MKTLDDLATLAELFPKLKTESPVAWVSRARGNGILDEEEWDNACKMIKANSWLFATR